MNKDTLKELAKLIYVVFQLVTSCLAILAGWALLLRQTDLIERFDLIRLGAAFGFLAIGVEWVRRVRT